MSTASLTHIDTVFLLLFGITFDCVMGTLACQLLVCKHVQCSASSLVLQPGIVAWCTILWSCSCMQGVQPVLRTYNTLIIACNMCNQPREALSVYTEMLGENFMPNSTTYNALISAYGKLGQLEKVLEVYQDMVWKGLERSVITYSSLISACEKAGRWETALKLFDEMQRDGCTPNTVTYNSLITACGQGVSYAWRSSARLPLSSCPAVDILLESSHYFAAAVCYGVLSWAACLHTSGVILYDLCATALLLISSSTLLCRCSMGEGPSGL